MFDECDEETKHVLTLLYETKKAVLIGSRAFSVQTKYSDWDLCILKKDLPAEIIKTYNTVNIKNYLMVIPLNNSELVKLAHIDIIIYENEQDLEVIKKTKTCMKNIPQSVLKHKYLRVQIFEQILLDNGFKRTGDLNVC